MGLTCSLLGHAFEADGVEREREQRGDEVVTVVRETETCSRCGEQRVVSETTEVTSVLDRDETALGADAGGEEAAPDRNAGAPTSGALDGMVDRADAEERDDVARGEVDPSGDDSEEPTHPRVDPDEDYDPPEDPSEEDAEILGGGLDDDRDPGEWPDDGGSTGTDAGATDPEEPAAPDATDAPDDRSAGDAADSGAPGDAAAPRSVGGSGDAAGAGRFVCEECGFSTPAAGSSLREGDSCPECNTGWLIVERGERNP